MPEAQQTLPAFTMLPFALMLAAIAVLPLLFPYFWDHNTNKLKVALALSVPTAAYLIITGLQEHLYHAIVFDYVPFLVLLGSLFIITGGIVVTGDIEAKPIVNTAFLALGAVLASVMGTTGASMLLIRPLLQTNREREIKVHTMLFFIGIVANCGGLLTPLGDPPLFMLYLRGVPFGWFSRLWPIWLFANGSLLAVYFVLESYLHGKESVRALQRDRSEITPIRIAGGQNFILLIGVVASVALLNEQVLGFLAGHPYRQFIREAAILTCAALSLALTTSEIRTSNNFAWAPIEEVACLFFGIFVTMVPCVLYLKWNAESLGIVSPIQFYYSAGALSSVLDNTPTALTFHSLALGLTQRVAGAEMVASVPASLLRAIAVGAVYFGSLTYIGNGPNFMVKAIADSNGVKMPNFFRYIWAFSLPVLLPVFVLVHLIFL